MSCNLLPALLATVLVLASAPFATADDSTPAAPPASEGLVYVIPVQGMIERGLLYAFRRGLDEARANGADAIVLDMDTPGGKLDTAEQMVLLLLDSSIPTYTFVHPRAISAGAIIAFATDAIYMTPTGLIGDAMPIMMSPLPTGGAQAVPEDLKEKVMSPTLALMRSAAQAKGHDPALGEAMIRPEAGYSISNRVICPEGHLLTLTATEAVEPLREGGKPLLAAGLADNLTDMLATIGHAESRVVTVEITTAEKIARVIEGFPFSGILLALGLLGLYIEFKVPGFGFPGIGGMCCLALWFWGHHIAGLSSILELLMFTVGAILLLTEIFLLPGFGAAGIAGVVMMLAAVLMSMVELPPVVPVDLPALTFPTLMRRRSVINLGFAMTLLLGAMLILARYLPKTAIFGRLMLTAANTRAAGYTVEAAPATLIGRRGRAVTALRPAGIGDFDGERLSVVTHGTFVDQGSPIVVAEVEGNRIIVDAVTPPA
ncbi:MAG: hypothetical protein O3B24_06175 [Verrucomicrobia bacterium]|nr:hypothetical protein [Verrucomicrobiota bacterium]